MNRVNTDVDLDPDFGKTVPPVDTIYSVTVLPKEGKPYKFILLMPILTNPESEEEALVCAAHYLCEHEDDVRMKGIPVDAYKDVTKATFVASFDPNDPQRFIWLNPPRHLKH